MLKTLASSTTTLITSPLLHCTCSCSSASSSSSSATSLSKPFLDRFTKSTKHFHTLRPLKTLSKPFSTTMNLLNKLGFGSPRAQQSTADASIAQGPDDDVPAPGQQFAQFGAGCFWGVELAFQRASGVTKTEVGYTQGFLHNPTYEDVCSGTSNHSEVVRVQYDPKECSFDTLFDVFWTRHDPTTLNRQVRLLEILFPFCFGCSIVTKCDMGFAYFVLWKFVVLLIDHLGISWLICVWFI